MANSDFCKDVGFPEGSGHVFEPNALSLMIDRNTIALDDIPWALRCTVVLLGAMPLSALHILGNLLGTLAFMLPTRHRRVAFKNIRMCFPSLTGIQVWFRVWRNLCESGKGLLELPMFWRQPPARLLNRIRSIEGEQVWKAVLETDRPTLLAAPHLGAWELLNLYISTSTSTSILYREAKKSSVDKLLKAGRERLGANAIRADRTGLRELYRAAQRGDLLGILPDQQPKRGEGVFAPFFGHAALTMVLYSRLASRLDCKVVVGFVERLPWARGFRLHFKEGDPDMSDPDIETAVAALNRSIETCVAIAPDQYQWTYKRFSIRPDGSRLNY